MCFFMVKFYVINLESMNLCIYYSVGMYNVI